MPLAQPARWMVSFVASTMWVAVKPKCSVTALIGVVGPGLLHGIDRQRTDRIDGECVVGFVQLCISSHWKSNCTDEVAQTRNARID